MIISNIALPRFLSVVIESPIEQVGVNPSSFNFNTLDVTSINRFNKLTKLINISSAIQQDRNFICKKFNHTTADFNKSLLIGITIDFNEQIFKLDYQNDWIKTKHSIYHKFNGSILLNPKYINELEVNGNTDA